MDFVFFLFCKNRGAILGIGQKCIEGSMKVGKKNFSAILVKLLINTICFSKIAFWSLVGMFKGNKPNPVHFGLIVHIIRLYSN